jgi:prepilin signal peptidase PulO-like enzyme (type II secretory pathway)
LQNAAQNLAQHPLAKLCLAQGTLWFLPSAYPMAIPMRRIDQRLCVALMLLALGHTTYGLFLGDWLEPLARLVCDRLANHIPARCINATLLWLGLLASSLNLIDMSVQHAVWGAVAGYGSLWLVATVFERLTGKVGMGAGDFKLLAALGAWLGPFALIPLVLMASVCGALVGVWLQSTQRLERGGYVPFGPFLASAGAVQAFLGGADVFFYINWLL